MPAKRSVFHRNLTLKQRLYVIAIILLIPAITLRLFTSVYPFIQTVIYSTQNYNPAFPPVKFVGLDNFSRLASDPVVRASVTFTILFVTVSTFFQICLGLAV